MCWDREVSELIVRIYIHNSRFKILFLLLRKLRTVSLSKLQTSNPNAKTKIHSGSQQGTV